jgi:rRNA maturation endonuclease Nob1
MVKVQIWGYRCERCDHEWVPRNVTSGVEPKVCPKCKSPYWNVPRKTKKAASP